MKESNQDRGAQGSERTDTRWGKVEEFFRSRKGLWSQGWRNLKRVFRRTPMLVHIRRFFRRNPTLALSLLYLYVTVFGLLYSWALYRAFGINIFDYAESSDFLLAALKDPSTLVLLVEVLIFALLFYIIGAFFEGRGSKLIPTLVILSLLVYPALQYFVATHTASSIKDGEYPPVDVRYRSFSSSTDPVTEPGLQVIGGTQKAMFFYDVKNKRTIAVPQSQIVSVEVPE